MPVCGRVLSRLGGGDERGDCMTLELNRIYNEDCLGERGMRLIPDKSIDMILCDLPYGTTACKWDTVIPFEPLWAEYKRIIKPNGAIVLTASQPFTTALISSNLKMFKYELIWDKGRGFEPQLANIRPMKAHENICVFGNGKLTYNPQMIPCEPYTMKRKSLNKKDGKGQNLFASPPQTKTYTAKYPTSIIKAGFERGLHPTQKPVVLFEWLIRTYTNPGETVLDNCMGSGTTAIACINTGRNFIGFEKDPHYYEVALKRIADHVKDGAA
jgi:site-specific DNA-methyltransferase (adenine-specific)